MIVDDGEIRPFADALYQAQCRDCKNKLQWEAAFDADGTSYHAECCNRHYTMAPFSVKIGISKAE